MMICHSHKFYTTLRWMFLPFAVLFMGMRLAVANELPVVKDSTAEAKVARTKRVPLLVLFMSVGCLYCDRVLGEFLVPMMGNKEEYADRVIMRQIDIGSDAKLVDFSGKTTTAREFAVKNKVYLTPTIKFFDASGRLLASPIVGLSIPDFFGGILDSAIEDALRKVREHSDARGVGATNSVIPPAPLSASRTEAAPRPRVQQTDEMTAMTGCVECDPLFPSALT